jgi:hypothetical protein
MKMNPTRRLAGLGLLAGCVLAGTARAEAPQVRAEGAWSRATPPGASTAAVYVTLTSPDGDRLVGASSPASSGASVHKMSMEGNVMRMRAVPGGLALPAGQAVVLKPSGYHIMLTGLKVPLKQGQTVRVHLTFAKSAPVDLVAPIAGIGASAPPGGAARQGMSGMKMP